MSSVSGLIPLLLLVILMWPVSGQYCTIRKAVPHQSFVFWHLRYETYYTYENERVCCDKYRLDVHGYCRPICYPDCGANGYCSKPDRCECNSGYYKTAFEQICAPDCYLGCPKNSKCVAPNTCNCNTGYQKSYDGARCLPICNRPCTAANSFCAAPNTCDCVAGYKKINGNCEPICSNACGLHKHCAAPGKCICNEGYMPKYEGDSLECTPVCSESCGKNSKCVAPEQCACDVGYAQTDNIDCEPICNEDCPEHAHCAKPNECVCETGYNYHGATSDGILAHCKPQCQKDCSAYGVCVAPDVCDCLPGYKMQTNTNSSSNIELCLPICTGDCSNGFCQRPGVCICNDGYLMGPHNKCEPVCSLGCINGGCIEPEICSCNHGYRFEANSTHRCAPICEPECQNGDCVEPNFCLCHEHYEPLMANICQPYCQLECVNATCSAPNTCTCLEGYEPATVTVCKPKCENACEYGDCIAPDVCSCWENYENIDNHCQLIETTTIIIDTKTNTFVESTTTDETTLLPLSSTLAASTIATEFETVPDNLLLTSSNCNTQCKCWVKHDDQRLVSSITPKCINICVDDHDAPCLELSRCRCDAKSLELICDENVYTRPLEETASTETASTETASPEELFSYYSCEIKRSIAPLNVDQPQHQESEKKSNAVNDKVLHIVAWSLCAAAIASIALFVGKRYVNHLRGRSSGTNSSPFPNEAYEGDNQL